MKRIEAKGEFQKRDKSVIAGTYARYDMIAERGKGALCYDESGRAYIDFTAGIGVNALGFCDEGWIAAVTRQLERLQHVSNLYYTEPQIQVAEQLTQRTGMKKVFFSNSGAEANETAIKIARKYGNSRSQNTKNHILTMKNSFHGRTLAAITATGQEDYHRDFHPFSDGFSYCEPNDIAALGRAITPQTCAVLLEIIQGEGGVEPLGRKFLQTVQALCREKDLLFVIDEVQTGIGRTGKLFAYEHFGLQPDMVTFAKGIGGGLPLGGVLLGEKTAGVLMAGDHGSTYGGNPVACAGALEVLSRLDRDFLLEVQEKGEYLKKALLQLPKVDAVSGMGLMLGVQLQGVDAKEVVKAALEQGLMVLTAKKKLRLLPPLTITYEQIDQGLRILETML